MLVKESKILCLWNWKPRYELEKYREEVSFRSCGSSMLKEASKNSLNRASFLSFPSQESVN